jgi:hypothetical protein
MIPRLHTGGEGLSWRILALEMGLLSQSIGDCMIEAQSFFSEQTREWLASSPTPTIPDIEQIADKWEGKAALTTK